MFCCSKLSSQNCNAFLMAGDTLQFRACKIAERANRYYQYSREYQVTLDSALMVCPYFSYGYRAKSTAYLKSGDFVRWKRLIDEAVKYNTKEFLAYRAWCRYQFFRDYTGAIADLEWLEQLTGPLIEYSVDGNYHLTIAKGLCYKAGSNVEKAIAVISTQLEVANYEAGIFDYLHLGVLYLEASQYAKAIDALKRQEAMNNLAECQYYLALTYQLSGSSDLSYQAIRSAEQLYEKGMRLQDVYTEMQDKVYFAQILDFKNQLLSAK
jgi:tetratricopeptide (TPR) repeat protein